MFCICMCLTAKDGPVYCAAWSPLATEFCVVYGCILFPEHFTVSNYFD